MINASSIGRTTTYSSPAGSAPSRSRSVRAMPASIAPGSRLPPIHLAGRRSAGIYAAFFTSNWRRFTFTSFEQPGSSIVIP
jgi:hypothetical protein